MSRSLNKSVSTISKYESGQLSMGLDVLVDICRYLEIDVSSILPGTVSTSYEAEKERYGKYFCKRLYLYFYNGQKDRVQTSVVENDNICFRSIMFFDVPDQNDFHDCNYVYSGTVEYSDSDVIYLLKNLDLPCDLITIRIPSLSRNARDRVGIMLTISSYYQSLAIKILALETPAKDPESLLPKLKLTKEEIREISKSNFFMIL